MKTTIAILLVAGAAFGGLVGTGQESKPPAPTEPADKSAEQAAQPGAPPAARAAEPAAIPSPATAPRPANEKIELNTQNDLPLEIIKDLTRLAGLEIELEPRIGEGQDPAGKPIPGWQERVFRQWEGKTAREALEDFLASYGMVLTLDETTGKGRITHKASAVAEKKEEEEAAPPKPRLPTEQALAQVLPKINFQNEMVTDAIRLLASMVDVNLQIDPAVTVASMPGGKGPEGKDLPILTNRITESWQQISAREALEAILAPRGLMMVQYSNTTIPTVTFKPTQDPMFPRVIQLQYANLTNMYAVLTNALPSGRKVKEDTRTSSLVITASEKDFEMIQQILEKLDTPTRQILIEAKIMETSRNPKTIKGIDWAGTLSDQAITFGNGRTVGQTVTEAPGPAESITTTLPSGRQITSTTRSRYESNTKLLTDLGFGGLSVDTARGFFPHVAFLNADGLKVALSFLNSDSDTEIVATPRAVTLDNETAKLSITRLYPNFKITPGTQNTPAGAEITYTNLGTTLEVTPRIAGTNDAVSLKVVPEIGNIDSVDRKTVNNSVNEANVYAVRRIETHVMIPSGNTLVMGGLMSDQKTKAYSKVPILGDMPLLGLAFRRENKQRSKVNMLIFVTPTIVKPNDFQPTQSTFLQTRPKPDDDREESAWDSGKPYDWKSGLAPIK